MINDSYNQEYKQFYIMRPMVNLWKAVDTIAANIELEMYFKGPPKKVSELNNGHLLIEVTNKKQAIKIQQIKIINRVKVMVQNHSMLNYTKRTIRRKHYIDTDGDTLISEVKEDHIIDLYKVQRKEQREYVKIGTMILTFDRCNLPTHVKIGRNRFEIREYISVTRRCFKCQSYNHNSKSCHAQQTICVNCGEPQPGTKCHSPPHCVNCEEAHPASDKSCFYYRPEKEMLTYKTKEKVSCSEAKKSALKICPTSYYHKL